MSFVVNFHSYFAEINIFIDRWGYSVIIYQGKNGIDLTQGMKIS